MAKKPPSAYKKYKSVSKTRTPRNWFIIGIYVILALALVVPLVASIFGYTAYPGGHGGY